VVKIGDKFLFSITCHPQTVGQTEVVNHTLSTMLQAILKSNLKLWEECLPHIEFAYNRSVHSTVKVSLFQVVYGFNPRTPIDLLPLPPSKTTCFDASQRSEFIFKMHETTKLNIEKMNEKYQIAGSKGRKEVKLESGDLVWLHLRKERFPNLRSPNLCFVLMVLLRFLRKSLIMHINLNCLWSLGLVIHLTFQIYDLTWKKKMRFCHGRCQIKRGRMMRTSLHWIQQLLLLRYMDQLRGHEHNNYVIR
jgi:hypothetical protein